MELLDRTLSTAHAHLSETVLYAGPTYSPTALHKFFGFNHEASTAKYRSYLSRRKAGGPRELYPDRAYAVEWLRQAAVVKYVDGGWATGVLEAVQARTEAGSEGARREAAKIAWQVVSEEFGDGDLQKNHVWLYRSLMRSLGVGGFDSSGHALTGADRGFDGFPSTHGIQRCWTAAIAQQLIGLFSAEFFPESLGFNMAYETLPYHLLVTSWELRELGIDDHYFGLHITIDNADTGHAALAMLAVERYLAGVEAVQGVEERDKAWRRVQAGVCLADELPTIPSSPRVFDPVMWTPVPAVVNPPPTISTAPPAANVRDLKLETQVVQLLVRKTKVAQAMHCPSRLKIAGETIAEWLDPATLTPERATTLARALRSPANGNDGSWIGKRVMRELTWGGRMFGAFSRTETGVMRRWIEGTPPTGSQADTDGAAGAYELFVGTLPPRHTFFASRSDHIDFQQLVKPSPSPHSTSNPAPLSTTDLALLLPLWHTSLTLLELFPLSPARLASPTGMIALRLLRTQLGFPALHAAGEICAGLDHFDGGGSVIGLYEVAIALTGGLPVQEGEGWGGSGAEKIEAFCVMLQEMRRRPYRYTNELFGVVRALSAELYAGDAVWSCLADDSGLPEQVKQMGADLEETFGEWEDMLAGGEDEQAREKYDGARSYTSQVIHCAIAC